MLNQFFAVDESKDLCGMCGRRERGDDCPFCLPIEVDCDTTEEIEEYVDPDDGRYAQYDPDLYDRSR